jgi:hypothetical protein
MTTITHKRRALPRAPRPYWPRMNRWHWHLSPFAIICMIVIPIFWPVLAVIMLAGVFQVVLQVVLALVGNTMLYTAWLVAVVFVAAFGRWV